MAFATEMNTEIYRSILQVIKNKTIKRINNEINSTEKPLKHQNFRFSYSYLLECYQNNKSNENNKKIRRNVKLSDSESSEDEK
jgi:hypothetical protein